MLFFHKSGIPSTEFIGLFLLGELPYLPTKTKNEPENCHALKIFITRVNEGETLPSSPTQSTNIIDETKGVECCGSTLLTSMDEW
jgi:hypothetical protein